MTRPESANTVAQRARPRLLAGAVVAVLAAAVVTTLAVLVRDDASAVVRFDHRVLLTTTGWSLAHGWVDTAAHVGAYVLHPWVFRLAVLLAAVVLWRRGARTAALWTAVTLVVGTTLGALLKLAVSRARPVLDQPVAAAGGFSFPSGHALNAMLGCTLLVVLLWRPAARRSLQWLLVAVAVLLVLATGFDRLLLGVHFPSDVLAGYLVGGLVVASSWVAFGPILRERALRGAEQVVEEAADEPPDDETPDDETPPTPPRSTP